jgi:cholesterol transport system auxiliary component
MALAGCVSLGSEPPDSLLNLTSEASIPAGTSSMATRDEALAIYEPEVPAKIDVLRLPVQVSDTEVAYLDDAVWVEKPARLFRRLLAETVRVRTNRLVLDADDPGLSAQSRLRGVLREFGYDASSSSVVVRFDAIRRNDEGVIETQRFEAVESGVLPKAGPVGAALNRAANSVAREVADWVGE